MKMAPLLRVEISFLTFQNSFLTFQKTFTKNKLRISEMRACKFIAENWYFR